MDGGWLAGQRELAPGRAEQGRCDLGAREPRGVLVGREGGQEWAVWVCVCVCVGGLEGGRDVCKMGRQ